MCANKLQCTVVWLLAGRGNHQVTSKKDFCSKLYRSCPGLVLALEAFVSLLSIPDVEDGLGTEVQIQGDYGRMGQWTTRFN